VFFLGVVNHWVTFIAHKEKGDPTIRFYYVDSNNFVTLNKIDEQLPDLIEQRDREKVSLGINKKPNLFMSKMSIHCLFDIRKAFEIVTEAF